MSSDVTYVWGYFVDQLWAGLWAGTNRKGKKDMTKLTVKEIKAASKGARLHDGHGLYLTLTSTDRGKWSYRYRINGLSREMGLGPYPKVSMGDARTRHATNTKRINCMGVIRAPIAWRRKKLPIKEPN